MSNSTNSPTQQPSAETCAADAHWHTFEEILRRLHQEGIYVHPHQLAKFYIYHGLPVDLRYVPEQLQQRATRINDNYLGDMARLEPVNELPWYSHRFS